MYHARLWHIFSSRPINTSINLIIPRFGKRSEIGHVHYCDRQLARHCNRGLVQRIGNTMSRTASIKRYIVWSPYGSPCCDTKAGIPFQWTSWGASFSFQAKTQTCGAKAIRKDEPPIRASRRVHRTYWEDVWETRREERSWKGHREHQWR